MFTMMNNARFQVGLQGLGIGETAFQGALRYARERLQSRALSGPAASEKAADPLIVHLDVRRMLLTQKTLVEGSRMLAAYTARQLDLAHGAEDTQACKAAGKRAALLIPIVKAFLADMGQEVASLGVQVYGDYGHFQPITTRWHDNDLYGHVNNVVYYSYFDSAVNTYLIEVAGLDMHHGPVVGFVVSSSCDYFASISFPALIEVGLRVGKLGNSSVQYELAIFKAGEAEACAAGRFVHVFVDRQSNRPVTIPLTLREALQTLLPKQ